jgi:hypothetical protein
MVQMLGWLSAEAALGFAAESFERFRILGEFFGEELQRNDAGPDWSRLRCSLAYSAFAAMRMGMSGSASFHSARKS